jgi:hypothetical protein
LARSELVTEAVQLALHPHVVHGHRQLVEQPVDAALLGILVEEAARLLLPRRAPFKLAHRIVLLLAGGVSQFRRGVVEVSFEYSMCSK